MVSIDAVKGLLLGKRVRVIDTGRNRSSDMAGLCTDVLARQGFYDVVLDNNHYVGIVPTEVSSLSVTGKKAPWIPEETRTFEVVEFQENFYGIVLTIKKVGSTWTVFFQNAAGEFNDLNQVKSMPGFVSAETALMAGKSFVQERQWQDFEKMGSRTLRVRKDWGSDKWICGFTSRFDGGSLRGLYESQEIAEAACRQRMLEMMEQVANELCVYEKLVVQRQKAKVFFGVYVTCCSIFPWIAEYPISVDGVSEIINKGESVPIALHEAGVSVFMKFVSFWFGSVNE